MLCRVFLESSEKDLELKEDARAFSKVLGLWCGEDCYQKSEWSEMQQLSAVTDLFQITAVVVALEDAMMEKSSENFMCLCACIFGTYVLLKVHVN